jgi:ABC-type amino acid transport substrate-binding protein
MTFGNGVALRNFSRRFGAAQAGLCALLIFAFAGAALAAETEPAPLRVAVHDLEPYGGQSRDGLFNGASVELWRRVAEDRNWRYQLTLVPRMDDLLSGLQANTYDVAIGAITQRLPHQKFGSLADALNALSTGKTDAVVNSVGALQYLVKTRFAAAIAPPRGLLAPAYMAFALPTNSGLKKPLDQALTAVIASPEWRSVEESYFGQ